MQTLRTNCPFHAKNQRHDGIHYSLWHFETIIKHPTHCLRRRRGRTSHLYGTIRY